jgi:hypothetical protein
LESLEPATPVNGVAFVTLITKIIINMCNPGLRRSSYEDARETALFIILILVFIMHKMRVSRKIWGKETTGETQA